MLTRRWSIANQLNGVTAPVEVEPRPLLVGRLASDLAAGRLKRSDVLAMQQMLAYCAWEISHLDELNEEQRASVRAATYRFLRALPALEGDLRMWIKRAARTLQDTGASLTADVSHTGGRMLRAKAEHAKHLAADVFSAPDADLSALTVHSMKGEEREAVMVVIQRPHANDPTEQLELWGQTVAGEEIHPERAEERRVAFVALTRAQRYCLVAVPDSKRGHEVAAACSDLGFVSMADA